MKYKIIYNNSDDYNIYNMYQLLIKDNMYVSIYRHE